MEYFYRKKHTDYKILPPVAAGCAENKSIAVMEFIYPTPGIKIFIPRDHTGELTKVITEVAHRNPERRSSGISMKNISAQRSISISLRFLQAPESMSWLLWMKMGIV